jgi:small subunit ribosomal protein S6
MPLYEHVFLARQDASPQQVEELTTQIKGVVEQMGGKVAKTEQWGIRSLTYRMNKNRKAHFTLLNIDGPAAIVAEIERQERINEDVIRYITVRVDERDERGERGFGGGGFGGGFRGDRDRGDRGDRGDRPPRRPREEEAAPAAATEE